MTCATMRRGKSREPRRRPRRVRSRHDIMISIIIETVVPRVSVPSTRIAHGLFKSFPSVSVFRSRRCNDLGRRRCWVSIIIIVVYNIVHSVCMYTV